MLFDKMKIIGDPGMNPNFFEQFRGQLNRQSASKSWGYFASLLTGQ